MPYGENRLEKSVKQALEGSDDFLSYATRTRYGAHFEISFEHLQRMSASFATYALRKTTRVS